MHLTVTLTTGDQKPMVFLVTSIKLDKPGNTFKIFLTDGTVRTWALTTILSIN